MTEHIAAKATIRGYAKFLSIYSSKECVDFDGPGYGEPVILFG